jgi:hypothetical protein
MPASFTSTDYESQNAIVGNPCRFIPVEIRSIPHKRTGRNLSESKKHEISLRSENKVLMLQNESLLVEVENLRKQLRKALNDLERANKILRGHGLATILPTATEI